jgi:serine/threonine protein phosphatase PrpC
MTGAPAPSGPRAPAGTASDATPARPAPPAAPAASAPDPDPDRGEDALLAAYARAHDALVDRAEGEVTTAVSAIVRPGSALLVNSGDSGAFRLDKEGRVKEHTIMQELGPPHAGCLAHAVGLVPEGCSPEVYRWALEPGEWLLLASDGLLDAGLSEDDVTSLVQDAKNAEEAVNRLCTTVLRRMATFRAKPDNLSIVAVRARP